MLHPAACFFPLRWRAIIAALIAFTFSARAQPASSANPSAGGPTLNPSPPTIFVAGDSTAAPGGGGIQGWGVPFPSYFDPAKVNLVDGARGGRSSRTFITDGSWEHIISRVKA